MLAGCQPEVQQRAVALLRALEGGQSLGSLCEAAEAEVFEADDAAIGDAGQVHAVVPYVEVVLHPLIAVGAARHDTGQTG